MKFFHALLALASVAFWFRTDASAAPTHLVSEPPVEVKVVEPGVVLVDFGRVAFGNIALRIPADAQGEVTVRFGEAMKDGRVNRKPGATIRYSEVKAQLRAGEVVVAPPADKRNTTKPAILTPPEWGVVTPFRWVEIEGWPGELQAAQITRRAAFAKTWDDAAADFRCSDETLNRIWELCRYSIKATTFAGVYVDGDRERIPYEADAYLNQLSHYACDADGQMARDTFDYLIKFPTWPTEWAPHMIFIAHADWVRTGDAAWLAARYESLKPKLLGERARADGLLASTDAQIKRGDIVDWPVGERDGFDFKPVNTVVNAFHLRALTLMASLARGVGKADEADVFGAQFRAKLAVFGEKLFDPATGLYRDGEGSAHASLHANLFPLAFGLVPPERRAKIAQFLKTKGMACSVYAAQYLLEGLFETGDADAALALMLAPGDRSWRHMVESGTTITWEAWDNKYKPNQDWNHAWGAAPANLLPSYVLGVWQTAKNSVRIAPNPSALKHAEGKLPTPLGLVIASWKNGGAFEMSITLPPSMNAKVSLPLAGAGEVFADGKEVKTSRENGRALVEGEWTGTHRFDVR